MALHNSDSDINSCLAYEVLQNPDKWIGCPSAFYLNSFLEGAKMRSTVVSPDFPFYCIDGILNDPDFYQRFVDATGHPGLTIKWAHGLALTHFSFSEGWKKLRDEALVWHRENGVTLVEWQTQLEAKDKDPSSVEKHAISLWQCLVKRPHMYMSGITGWDLFCLLNGMVCGGDWLDLPKLSFFEDAFNQIKARSIKSYGSEFGAFRLYDSKTLLEWVDLPGN